MRIRNFSAELWRECILFAFRSLFTIVTFQFHLILESCMRVNVLLSWFVNYNVKLFIYRFRCVFIPSLPLTTLASSFPARAFSLTSTLCMLLIFQSKRVQSLIGIDARILHMPDYDICSHTSIARTLHIYTYGCR